MKRLTIGLSALLVGLVLAVPAASHDNGGHGGHGAGNGPPCENPTLRAGKDNYVVGTNNRDVIRGSEGSDVIKARAGDDIVCGNNGSDRIYGERGDDWLQGNHGADTLVGGRGHDRVTGGAGGGDTCRGEHVNRDSCENVR